MVDCRITRLAPSPTGALHLGNARSFLINWALARQAGWQIVLRIEDLDTPRTKAGADRAAIDDLRWLQMDWDEGPTTQIDDLSPYEDALTKLQDNGQSYRCTCSRKDLLTALSAPHVGDHDRRYPGICRNKSRPVDLDHSIRLIVPDETITFEDKLCGPQKMNVQQTVGDFIIRAKSGLPAYQLAVVIDDAKQGVTDIVRGDDLLTSTARQLWLYRLLDLSPIPTYWHLPLVLGEDGRRLAKRHGDTRIAYYQEQGVPAERIIGLIASWSGFDDRQPMSAEQFRETFDLENLPRQPVTFSQDDHRWLMDG